MLGEEFSSELIDLILSKKRYKLSEKSKRNKQKFPGIYIIFAGDEDQEIYVGKTTYRNISKRLNEHYKGSKEVSRMKFNDKFFIVFPTSCFSEILEHVFITLIDSFNEVCKLMNQITVKKKEKEKGCFEAEIRKIFSLRVSMKN